MQYKSIVFQLLEQRPQLYAQLRQQQVFLRTLEGLANALRSSHEAWKSRLWESRPDSDESQIASEAAEIALQELEACLPSESQLDEESPLSLAAAIAYIRGHIPPA
jgi:hypothetical protein